MDIRNKKMHDLLLEYNQFLAVLDLVRYGLAGLFLARYNEVYERFKSLGPASCPQGTEERERAAGKRPHCRVSEGTSTFFRDEGDEPMGIAGSIRSMFHTWPCTN